MNTTTTQPTEMQPELPIRRRRRKNTTREQYFIDWSQYQSIWHLPDHWIAEALNYTTGGVSSARKRQAPEEFKTEPTEGHVYLQVAYPQVEGKRWTSEMILELLIEVESLEAQLAASKLRIDEMKKHLPATLNTEPVPNYKFIGLLVVVISLFAGVLAASLGMLGGLK
jgi:hypothetical protein